MSTRARSDSGILKPAGLPGPVDDAAQGDHDTGQSAFIKNTLQLVSFLYTCAVNAPLSRSFSDPDKNN